MSFKEFLKVVYRDIYGSFTRPEETAKRLKQSAGFDYGLKVMLVSSLFYFIASFLMSFVTDNIVLIYSILSNLDRVDLGNVASRFFGIVQIFFWYVFVSLFIGVPVFVVCSFIFAAIYWFSGKLLGGKAGYFKFYGAMMPVHMMLLLTVGLFSCFLGEVATLICAVAGISMYQKDMITFILSLVFVVPVFFIDIYYYVLFVKEIHEISKKNAFKAVIIPLVIFFVLGVVILLCFMLFATYLRSVVPFYGRFPY